MLRLSSGAMPGSLLKHRMPLRETQRAGLVPGEHDQLSGFGLSQRRPWLNRHTLRKSQMHKKSAIAAKQTAPK